MSDGWPKILTRRISRISPWASLIARDVEFAPQSAAETYHAVAQADYVSMLARTPDGFFPLVRQYRPAVESYTWELPAGTVDEGEAPEEAACRELLEETGFPARLVYWVGSTAPCTGRLSNRLHSYFIETGARAAEAVDEAGITLELVTLERLVEMIHGGEFIAQQHIGAVLQAALRGLIDLAPIMPPRTAPRSPEAIRTGSTPQIQRPPRRSDELQD
jgi:8-oxo-dGTP pyrophosphatase MutT (NUDIX family)